MRAFALVAAALVATVAVVDRATRPSLGPDLPDELARDAIVTVRTTWPRATASGCGPDRGRLPDVDEALRPEPAADFGAPPDEASPARRRTVALDPGRGVLDGRIVLVSYRRPRARR